MTRTNIIALAKGRALPTKKDERRSREVDPHPAAAERR